jgi:hypothetical protein
VPLAVAIRDSRSLFGAREIGEFTGRDWLLSEIDDFMASNACGYVMVEADAGVGKTALAAWLASTRGYVSHFCRYSGGRRTREALQNLSAQLIRDGGLAEHAPRGILPGWASDPQGFYFLLGTAAVAKQQRLVLVIDGLDEAEQPAGGLPLGLPAILPDGVFVVGTYRTGYPLPRPDCPVLDVRIARDDPRNHADINDYLMRIAREEKLSGSLADAGISTGRFTGLLAERCSGVWVYLRYVLEELRLGLRSFESIGELPTGLWNYYIEQVRRWQRCNGWNSELLPLLATLGVAGEPLTAVALSQLAGIPDVGAVRRGCDQVFRPLLSCQPGDGTSTRYEIYHNSFRDVIKGFREPTPDKSSSSRPYSVQALADELRHASTTAHGRIADAYLDYNCSDNCVAFHPSGMMLASTYDAPTVRVWNLLSRQVMATLNAGGTQDWCGGLVFIPTGGILVTITGNGNPGATRDDGSLQFWKTPSYASIATLARVNTAASGLTASSDSKTVAVLGRWGTITLWDVPTRTSRAALTGDSSGVTCIAFGPDDLLAGGFDDGTVTLWNTAKDKSISTLSTGRDSALNCVAISPDGKTIASGGANLTIWPAE